MDDSVGLPAKSPRLDDEQVSTRLGGQRPALGSGGTEGGASPEPGGELCLSVAAVARRLGVAPATLRTWDRRYGLGPAEHAPGAHRRYDATDLARLEAMQQALLNGVGPAEAARYALSVPVGERCRDEAPPIPEPPGRQSDPSTPDAAQVRSVRIDGRPLRMPGAGARARGLARAAVSLDAAAIHELLDASLIELGVVGTWDLVIRPVLGAIATCWAAAGSGVEIEHLVSEGALDAFRAAAQRAPRPRNRRPVLLACVPDELHSLPLYPLAAALAQRGVSCRVLGAALPADALGAAVRRIAPSVVFLWAQMPSGASADLLTGLPRIRQRVRICVGGPGWENVSLPRSAELLESLPTGCERIAAAASARPARKPMTTFSS